MDGGDAGKLESCHCGSCTRLPVGCCGCDILSTVGCGGIASYRACTVGCLSARQPLCWRRSRVSLSVCLFLRVVGERAGTLATARARGEGHRHACPCCRQLQRNRHSGTIHQQLAAIPPSNGSAGAEASRARGAGRPGWIVSSCLRLPTLQQAGAAWVRRMAYTINIR